MMTALRDEYLLVGRGQAWVRYVPQSARPHAAARAVAQTAKSPTTQAQYDQVIWEEAVCDHVHWEDFGTNPARSWAKCASSGAGAS